MDKAIDISENMYISEKSIITFSKFLGLAPFQVFYEDRTYKMALSKKYLFCSYLFGLLLVSLTILGLVYDWKAGDSSLKMTSTKAAIITICDVFFIILISVIGIFGTPFRLKTFWKYCTLLKEVDKIIKTNDGKQANKAEFKKLTTILGLVSALLIYTMVVEDRTVDDFFSIKNYIVFYFLYIIVFMVECQYWHVVQSVGRRFKRLNECLDQANVNNKLISSQVSTSQAIRHSEEKMRPLFTVQLGNFQKYPRNNKQLKVMFDGMVRPRNIEDISTLGVKTGLQCSAVEFISKISEAHGKLFEAVNTINDGLGFLSLVIIMSCLFHLVVTPYFLLLDLLVESNSLLPNLILQFLWVITHLCRLLIIIEPCFATCEESQNTNPLVAKMLCSDLDEYYKKQLQMFSLQLVHREIEFSAFGLCSIDRPLLTAIAGAITTYLVILLQFR